MKDKIKNRNIIGGMANSFVNKYRSNLAPTRKSELSDMLKDFGIKCFNMNNSGAKANMIALESDSMPIDERLLQFHEWIKLHGKGKAADECVKQYKNHLRENYEKPSTGVKLIK